VHWRALLRLAKPHSDLNSLQDVGLRTGPNGGLSDDGNISPRKRKKEYRELLPMTVTFEIDLDRIKMKRYMYCRSKVISLESYFIAQTYSRPTAPPGV